MLRVLIVEDNPYDVELTLRELRRAGFAFEHHVVASEADYAAALGERLDVILCDYTLPGFDGLRALAMLGERRLDIPFILLSATAGEEVAVAALKAGAADYLIKDRLARLGAAIEDALANRQQQAEAARARAASQASEERFRALIEHSSDAFATYDREARPLYLSPSHQRLFGYPLDELREVDAFACVWPADLEDFRQRFFAVRDAPGSMSSWETRICHRDGTYRYCEAIATNLLAKPSVSAIVVCYRDQTERKRQEARIQRLTQMRAVLSAMRGALLRVHDRDLLIKEACRIAVSEGGLALAWIGLKAADGSAEAMACCGTAAEEATAEAPGIVPGSPADEAMRLQRPIVEKEIGQPSGAGFDRRCILAAGLRSAVSLPLHGSERTLGVLVFYAAEPQLFDAAEVRLLEDVASDVAYGLEGITRDERVTHLAFYDGLTGLPNRAQFFERLEREVQAANQNASQFAAILFDILRFRQVNDVLGWRGGDRLLKALGDRLRQLAGDDFLARIGNDRFCVLLPIAEAGQARRFVESGFAPAFELEYFTARGAYSAQLRTGAAIYPRDGHDVDTLLRNAEAAVAEAKRSNIRKYALYAPDMNARAVENLALEERLRRATSREEFEQFDLYYQPKIDFGSGRISGIEALIRWHDPDLGPVPPGAFVPVLEETGLILEVGRWVIRRAISDHRRWTAQGIKVPRIAVNVSPLQLRERGFHQEVLAAVEEVGGLEPGGLDLEITENILMQDLDDNIRKLQAVREAGLGIAIDDFGTGYSSLSYLARLPVNTLKIDQSFVKIMTSSPADMAIVSTIISLAHSLGFDVVAEGVETEEQARFLTLLRCDEGQGFLFEQPLPPPQIEALLRDNQGPLRPSLSLH